MSEPPSGDGALKMEASLEPRMPTTALNVHRCTPLHRENPRSIVRRPERVVIGGFPV